MFNNNSSYEKHSNTTTASTQKQQQQQQNVSIMRSEGSISNNVDIKSPAKALSNKTTKPGTTSGHSTTTTNDNGYFNRFDNRIAANLAAVLNGARRAAGTLAAKTSTLTTSLTNNSHFKHTNTCTNANINDHIHTQTHPHCHVNLNRNSQSDLLLFTNNTNANSNLNLNANANENHNHNVNSNLHVNLSCSNNEIQNENQNENENNLQCHHSTSEMNEIRQPKVKITIATTLPSRYKMPPMHLQLSNILGLSQNRSRPNSPTSTPKRRGSRSSLTTSSCANINCSADNMNIDSTENVSVSQRHPMQPFNSCNDNEKVAQTPSSDEDNSPTELNNCKRLTDKPPLVKRLTMGLMRANEEGRPLVFATTTATTTTATGVIRSLTDLRDDAAELDSSNRADSEIYETPQPITTTTATTAKTATTINSFYDSGNAIYSNGYINEEAFEPEKFIASKFGDSCRQSLTAIPMLDCINLNDNSEFNLKKRYLRETSSANSSPKIFANRLRMNANSVNGRYNCTHSAYLESGSNTNNINQKNHLSHQLTNINFTLAPATNSPSTASLSSTNTTTTMLSTLTTTTTAPTMPLVNTIEDDECELKDACWFQAGISREIAVEVLTNKSPGAFLVRKSTSKPGCYALTLRVPSPPGPKIANYIILRTVRGYKIKGFRKEFTSLRALITHHSVMPELLPVPLAMPRPTNMTSSRRNLDDFDTYDSLQMLLKYLRAKNAEAE